METICLLLALKVEHPKSIHLIRGNHEVCEQEGRRQGLGGQLGVPGGVRRWERGAGVGRDAGLPHGVPRKLRGRSGVTGAVRRGMRGVREGRGSVVHQG